MSLHASLREETSLKNTGIVLLISTREETLVQQRQNLFFGIAPAVVSTVSFIYSVADAVDTITTYSQVTVLKVEFSCHTL